MKRYHRKVYMPSDSDKNLRSFTDSINAKKWLYSRHSIDSLKYRDYNKYDILLHIKEYMFKAKEIFEYYTSDTGYILKVCFRIAYSENMDLILVISDSKNLITIYGNTKNDNHITLKKELYTKD